MKISREKYIILFPENRFLSNNGIREINKCFIATPKIFQNYQQAEAYMNRHKYINYQNYQIKKVYIDFEWENFTD